MFELRVSRRRRPSPGALLFAAASGAITTSAVTALRDASRRARAKNRMTSAATHTADLMGKAARDARNRASGAAATAKSLVRRDETTDEKLVARVRSRLGRVVSHPHAIQVNASAESGHVVLSGPILRGEVDRLLQAVRHVRGVRAVVNELEVHERGENVPALQGPGRPPRAPELLQERWTPSLRVGAALLGLVTAAAGAMRLPRIAGVGLTGIGSLLVARAAFDEPIGRILGLGATRRSVEVQKTITIAAPLEEVFSYFSNVERYAEFMDHVEQVTGTGEGRSLWRVRGPLGTSVEWDAETTSFRPNHHIAWKSADRALVKQAGIIRFEPVDGGRATRVDIHLSYNPVAGYIGHGIATLFGVDAKTSLDEDLLRMKSLLEEGKATAHGREIERREGAEPPREGAEPEPSPWAEQAEQSR